MENLQYLQKAKRLIEEVRGKTLSIEDRKILAIELAALMLNSARLKQTASEYRIQSQLGRMMNDPIGKIFTTTVTDECFRSNNAVRVADQILFLLNKFGIPKYLPYFKKLQFRVFQFLGNKIPHLLIPLVKKSLRKESSQVIIPGEYKPLLHHIQKRRKENVRINLNQLGEAILGEAEAFNKMQIYLNDLSKPEVEYISVKISTLYSQIRLISWDETLNILECRLKELYRTAMCHTFICPDGKHVQKFVNLDMEEYRDLSLTVELFRRVLDDPEFFQYSAGIVLQSYLPDSYLIQQELTLWAMQRVANGGAKIKIRIVKGANLAMERLEASLHGWPQAPYTNKIEVDANYKRMLTYGALPEHAQAVCIGVGSHNLFDIAYVLILRAEFSIEKHVEFEMLEGMADHMRRVVQFLSGSVLLYCPAAKTKEFPNAIAYLVRRLDENTAKENFLRHAFDMLPGTIEWEQQANLFSQSCQLMDNVGTHPRRFQNRFEEPIKKDFHAAFCNEPDTDWSLTQNRKWAHNLIKKWKEKKFEEVPIVIDDKEITPKDHFGIGRDPSYPDAELYRYALASPSEIDQALKCAEKAQHLWEKTTIAERYQLLSNVAQALKANRGELISAMVADAGKIITEADGEISEAIDFVEYYRKNMEELSKMEDINWQPKGTVLIAPPWNFPASIPMGGIAASLATGNCVIFKPASETAYIGWKLANICWNSGISRQVLQFVLCEDEPVGSLLIKDPRVSCVLLTGSTETAKKMLNLRPGLDIMAETGGKNALIITAMSDRDLAVKDLVHSAFGHSGQKCSACSLAICETEVYDDPLFRKALRDATESLKVGATWDFSTRVNPLIRPAGQALYRSLTQLDPGEEWLLEPKQDPENPNLWSPGIKLGVKNGSFMHQTELFGPILGVMKAKNLEEAIKFANRTPYGLTSGIHTLDEREQDYWMRHIEAGNCYVNRGITGAIVQRQPFGGCKESSFGSGAKAGGPNYLMQLMHAEQTALPNDQEPIDWSMNILTLHLKRNEASKDCLKIWMASIGSYIYHFKHTFSKEQDFSRLVGQDNILKYVPREKILLRIGAKDQVIDQMRLIAAAQICKTPLDISIESDKLQVLVNPDLVNNLKNVTIFRETETEFLERIQENPIKYVRFISEPSLKIKQVLASLACSVTIRPPLANGRIELFHYFREVSLSIDYHRYGNLGLREEEKRSAIL